MPSCFLATKCVNSTGLAPRLPTHRRRIDRMPPKKKASRPKVPQVLAAVVQPVTKRLSRMEDLLIEMRGEHAQKLKRVSRLERQIDELPATIEEQFSRASAAS